MANYYNLFCLNGWVIIFILLFCVGGVLAVDEWGDINVGENSSNEIIDEDHGKIEDIGRDDVESVSSVRSSSFRKLTLEFYISLILGLLVLVIIGFVVYSLLKKPGDRFRK